MEEEVEFNDYLHAKEPFLTLSLEACRQSGGWTRKKDVPTPMKDELHKGESTEAHKKMARQFINDIVRTCSTDARDLKLTVNPSGPILSSPRLHPGRLGAICSKRGHIC